MNTESRIIEVNTPVDQIADIAPATIHSGPETFSSLVRVANEFEIPALEIGMQLRDRLEKAEGVNYQQVKNSNLPTEVKDAYRKPTAENERLITSAAYYQAMIKPLIATGTDVYRPSDEDILRFCEQIDSPRGVNFVLYYALSKTQSPRRTGSSDNLIDFAEIEMLKYYALMGMVADRMGLNVSVTVVDETDVLPEDDLLDINDAEREANRYIAQAAVAKFGASKFVKIRSLRESVVKPLGEDFVPLAVALAGEKVEQVKRDLETDAQTALKIRMFTFLDCVPDKSLYGFGLTNSEVIAVRSMDKTADLRQLPEALLDFLIKHTAGFAAIMELRGVAEGRVRAGEKINEFPEYSDNRISTGITRSATRLSLKPHPVQHVKTTNPMHGLALYRNNHYAGVVEYETARQEIEGRGRGRVIRLGRKPVFVTSN